MRQLDHPILDQVAALDFPKPSEVTITHGSALVIYGVREAHIDGDIDIVTTPENIAYALERLVGWKAIAGATSYYDDRLPTTLTRIVSPDGMYDMYGHDFVPKWYQKTGRGRVYPGDLLAFSEQDKQTGIRVATPRFVRLTKEGSMRQNDIDDIHLIDEYLLAA
ncbi:MAG: hypothetical protein JWO61_114 [Candidatus Saccharibacteria bacterium]|nr:hypothetical protein [Candidatus Saccharibacteria bacterium]